MSPAVTGPLIAAFVLGVLLGSLVALTLRSRRSQTEVLAAASGRAAAEAAQRLAEERRAELEHQLEGARASLAELSRAMAVAEEREAKAQQLIVELKQFSEESRRELSDRFKSLAADVLTGTNKQFLELAQERFQVSEERGRSELEKRKKEIETLLQPLGETIKKLDANTSLIEKARVDAYSRIDQQVQMLAQATQTLQEKTTTLATALRSSQVRGRWGEIALRNVAELAGMTEHCDFYEQTTAGDGKRPDMTVKLPGGRLIAVDAKAPLTDYLDASAAGDEASRNTALDRHVKSLKGHIRALASKEYAEALGSELDLVVMFLPGDPFLSAAFEREPDLQVEALRSKVLLATPTTLVALLRTVAIYWQQRSLAENAENIAQVARDLYQRAAKFSDDLDRIGKGLGAALKAYNDAVGSFDRRVVPMGRKLEELKVSEQTKRDLVVPESIDEEPRKLTS